MSSYSDKQQRTGSTDGPDFEMLVDPETEVRIWLWEVRQSATLRRALMDAEEYVRSQSGGRRHIDRSVTIRAFCDVVRSPSVAEAIHTGSLTFTEVLGLRGQQAKAMGAVAASLRAGEAS